MAFCFFDWETWSEIDLTIVGGLKYVLDPSTSPLLLSWAIDDDPVKLWCPDLSAELDPEVWASVKAKMAVIHTPPAEIVDLLAKPDGYLIAANAAFDRHVWQQIATPDLGFPEIRIEQTLDAMAQWQASNLPGKLDLAGRALNLGQKTVGGSAVMKRFADRNQPLPGSPADIANQMAKGLSREKAIAGAIEMWGIYCTYAIQDTDLMRDIWRVTRPLDADEWQEYWDNEHINDRGMPVDLEIAEAAVLYRAEEEAYTIERIKEITQGVITKTTLTKQINEWIFDRLPDDLAETMVRARDDEGYVTRLTGSKVVITQLLEDIDASDAPPDDDVIELLELLQYGRSSSAVKFEKILHQAVDGRLTGSYVFNGAGQTGRGCLEEGTLLITLDVSGEIIERKIEELRDNDLLWDGHEWVAHEGVVDCGVKTVYEYNGVSATADHKLYISDTEYTRLSDAVERGIPIFEGTSPCTQYTR